jgi:hypothetical protein
MRKSKRYSDGAGAMSDVEVFMDPHPLFKSIKAFPSFERGASLLFTLHPPPHPGNKHLTPPNHTTPTNQCQDGKRETLRKPEKNQTRKKNKERNGGGLQQSIRKILGQWGSCRTDPHPFEGGGERGRSRVYRKVVRGEGGGTTPNSPTATPSWCPWSRNLEERPTDRALICGSKSSPRTGRGATASINATAKNACTLTALRTR